MNLTTIIVLVLTAIAFGSLVFFEINSRRNEAKLKAVAATKATETSQSNPASELRKKHQVT